MKPQPPHTDATEIYNPPKLVRGNGPERIAAGRRPILTPTDIARSLYEHA
jgi:hypothetical protein